MKLFRGNSVALLLLSFRCAAAIDVNLDDPASIKTAAATIAYDLMTYYTGNISGSQNGFGYPGILQLPYAQGGYYWWEAGGMWGVMVDYWYYTGDTSYNDVVNQALVFQADAPRNDYLPANQSASMGNDDQGFWGMSAMTAAETNFPPPSSSQIPGWLALAQGVFNTQAARWDTSSCGGGMRWQVNLDVTGYNYKNSISNGVFFNIGSRLALYTGNATYYHWANQTYTWMTRIGLLNSTTFYVFDGSDDTINCTQIDHNQWTYNAGIFLFGAANMYNYTSSLDASEPASADAAYWKAQVMGLATGIDVFFTDGIMYEPCEPNNSCNINDQRSFKTYLARWMAATTKIAPFTYDILKPKMVSSAQAAALQCSGGVNAIGTGAGRQCGLKWTQNATYDGDTGAGQQMAALEIIQGNLINQAAYTFTNTTGGTSQGDPTAGTTGTGIGPNGLPTIVVTQADKVGAGFITFFTLAFVAAACWWMVSAERLSDTPTQAASRDRKREWGWGDLSVGGMGRKQFTQNGYADRDSMALEKLKMSGGSGMVGSNRGSPYDTQHNRSESNGDAYGSSTPWSNDTGSRPGSRGVQGYAMHSPLGQSSNMMGGSGSRPGSSRAMQDGGLVPGRPIGEAV